MDYSGIWGRDFLAQQIGVNKKPDNNSEGNVITGSRNNRVVETIVHEEKIFGVDL